MNETTVMQGQNMRNKIMDAIVGYIEVHKYPPTVREIGELVGLKSTASVQCHLEKLLDEGRLETDAQQGSPRAIRVPGYKFVK